MHIPKQDIPVRLAVPGAVARQRTDFGATAGYGPMAGEYFSLATGTDIAPLLVGLDGDLCAAPHWGYLIDGEVVVSYADGAVETCRAGDLFHWPPGHSVRVEADAEVVLFSPGVEHGAVLDHMEHVIEGMTG